MIIATYFKDFVSEIWAVLMLFSGGLEEEEPKYTALQILGQFLAESSSLWAAVSALAALFAIYQVAKVQREAIDASRPYFVVKEPGFKPLDVGLRLYTMMINEGGREATDFEYRFLISELKPELNGRIFFDTGPISISAPLPVGSPSPFYNDGVVLPENLPEQFVFLGMKYNDLRAGRHYSQGIVMRWSGVDNGHTQPDFVYTSKEQAQLFFEAYPNLKREYSAD